MAHAADNIELSAPSRPAARDRVEPERPETAAKGRIDLQGVVKCYDAITAEYGPESIVDMARSLCEELGGRWWRV